MGGKRGRLRRTEVEAEERLFFATDMKEKSSARQAGLIGNLGVDLLCCSLLALLELQQQSRLIFGVPF